MSSARQTYADAVRTRVDVQYADDVVTYHRTPAVEDVTNPLLFNRAGYISFDWRSYRTPMMVSYLFCSKLCSLFILVPESTVAVLGGCCRTTLLAWQGMLLFLFYQYSKKCL